MTIIDLSEEQVEIIEDGLSAYDDGFIQTKLDGNIQLGILENGELIVEGSIGGIAYIEDRTPTGERGGFFSKLLR